MMIKKLLLIPTIWLLLVSISFTDGGEIYLPIITKSGDCMASNAILEITDGTAGGTIDLLQTGIDLAVDGWNPASPPLIPAMQSSPFTDGSEPSSYKFGNATEAIDFKAGSIESSNTQDTIIEMVQDFRRILIQGINYHVVDWHNSIVYIRARASCETHIRYAPIKTYSLPEDDDPYQQPFIGSTLMDGMSVLIERGDWLGAVPGVGECQEVNTTRITTYQDPWELNFSVPAGGAFVFRQPRDLMQASNGYIFLSVSDYGIVRSINDGGAWALSDAGTGVGGGSIETLNNTIVAGIQQGGVRIRYSTNFGGVWNSATWPTAGANIVRRLFQKPSTDRIFAAAEEKIIYSDDDGQNWSDAMTISGGIFDSILVTNDGTILAGGLFNKTGRIYRSVDNGTSWVIVFSIGGTDTFSFIRDLYQTSDGSILAGSWENGAGVIYKSINDGSAWFLLSEFPSLTPTPALFDAQVNRIREFDNGNLYATYDDGLWESESDGVDWVQSSIRASSLAVPVLELANGVIMVGLYDGDVLTSDGYVYASTSSTVTLGSDDTCLNENYIKNCENTSNITFVKIDDGGVFTDIFPIAVFPQDLLPAVPVANDAIYFGNDSTITFNDMGPFSSLVFDLIPLTTTDVYDMIWEYYDGGNWIPLIVTDNTNIEGPFSNEGVNSVHWEQPSDWATVAVDGVTGYWVRCRLNSLDGAITSPQQQNRDIYSILSASFDINDENVGGDIPALARYKILNQSDGGGLPIIKLSGTHDGPNNNATLEDSTATFIADAVQNGWYVFNTTDGSYGQIYNVIDSNEIAATLFGGVDNDWDTNDAYEIISGPDLWSNRVYVGLRSSSRGDNFRAYINISDEQNVIGVTVTAGTNATFGNDTTTPTGRRLTYGALAGDTTFVDRAIITMSSSIVRDYYGKFHVFIRGRQVSGSAGDITLRIQVRTGSGGITFTTPEQTFSGTNDWELLDFDAFTIPAGGRVITPSELGDTGVIAIQAKNDSGSGRDVYIYDLILIPTDEWAGDFTDLADVDDSIIGKQDDVKHFIDIDSVRNPKVLGRSLVRLDDANESISANYEFDTNGEVILQANADQRVWVISAHIGSNDEWLSLPYTAWSVQAYKNQRYLTQRGSR